MSLLLLAAAATVAPLQPSGPWSVETSDNVCLLSRSYGSGSDTVVVGFQPFPGSGRMDVVVVGAHSNAISFSGNGVVQWLPGGLPQKAGFYSVPLKSGKRMTRLTVKGGMFEKLGQASALNIKAGRLNVPIAITKFDKAFPVFAKCQSDLLRSWGVDPANYGPGRTPTPLTPPESVFTSRDYPRPAARAEAIGRTVALLQVDDQGAVSNCRIVAPAGKVFDDVACERGRLIKFNPGRDASGKPTASVYLLPVNWQMLGY